MIRANFGIDPHKLTKDEWAGLFGEAVWIENMRLKNLAKILSKLFASEED